MAKDLKKFVNPKFTRTIDLALMRRLMVRHQAALRGFDLATLDVGAPTAREALQGFFAGPQENYPPGLVADLHRIAELGNANGLRLLQEQAGRLGLPILPEQGDGDEERQDPKHVALRMFLDQPGVFDAASDMLALIAHASLAEFAGVEEGVEPLIDDRSKAEFERAASAMFEADLRGRYCRVGWYEDDDEINLVVAHGSTFTTTQVVEEDGERVISFRATEHAVLSYSSAAGRLKIGGVSKARRAEVAELFARTMLQRPAFFAAPDAQNLYTLQLIERAGFGFIFNHDFDPGIQRVQIVEAQVDRIGLDPRSGHVRTFWSHVTRDNRDNALARLGETMRGVRFGADWRLNHLVLRVYISTGSPKPTKLSIKLKPPDLAMFKRHRFEGRIMTLLRRNGLVNDREPLQAAVAAE